ncbi:MAG: DUF4236 domain-containing protein [Polaromonas sp.]|nr:DUF4236 domain-containing protein [Polaromonas sp.]
MGLSYSKSIKFGAVRFNFSGSGIGVSVGIPGLRIGTGPRGAYISGGAGGFRYRQSLRGKSSRSSQPLAQPQNQTTPLQPSLPVVPNGNVLASVEHDVKNVLELTDSSGDELVKTLNEQNQFMPRWPWVAAGSIFLFIWGKSLTRNWYEIVHVLFFAALGGLIYWVYWRDQLRKLTVLFFELDQPNSDLFSRLASAILQVSTTHRLSGIAATSQYADKRYTAGATAGLQLKPASFSIGQVPGIVTNIEIPMLKGSKKTLAFFPDRILAFEGKQVGSISYKELDAQAQTTRFVEDGIVPSDATIIGHTWQYVRNDGGPDRRFANNRQLPLCSYHQLNLSSSRGLDLRLMASRTNAFDEMIRSLASLR